MAEMKKRMEKMASKAQVDAFIKRMAPIAIRQAKKHGNKIFPSVCIAQACCESAYGTTQRMIKANAVFGIKVGKSAYHFGKAWKDLSYNTKTKEVVKGKYEEIRDDFRAYASLEDATEDYFDLLCTASRYKKALNAKDYKTCIRAIAPSYATAEQDNCKYSKTVISIIEKYSLTKYDSGEEEPTQDKTLDDVAREVIAGRWGNGAERRRRLMVAGYNPSMVQARVNELLKK